MKDIKKKFLELKKTANDLAQKTVQELENSGKLDEIKKVKEDVKNYMEEAGITEKAEQGINKAKEMSEMANEHFDKVSGKEILKIVEERLRTQTEYNDLIATKVEEALERISVLENTIGNKN